MTNTIIAKMLRENTGRHFMDSGDAYGRNWERNQGRKFDEEPPAVVDFTYGVEVTINVYHFLKERLTLSQKMDRRFKRFCNRAENKGESCLALMEGFTASIGASGLYGEGSPITVNTCCARRHDLLSQTIQFTLFRYDYTDYVILQIHGGADVRGGYTTPRVFEINDDAACMFDNTRATIYCTGDRDKCGAYWDTDDGYHWYREGEAGLDARTQLQDYDRLEELKGESREAGKLFVQFDGTGLCPCCGSPLKVR